MAQKQDQKAINFFLFLLFCLFYLFIFWGATLGLHCYVWSFSSCGERGLRFVVVRGLLTVVASLVAQHRL